MLILEFTALFLLAALNYYLGRSLFYPAFVFCAAWTLALGCLLVSGDMFFSISAETLSIFMWGAVAFSIGSTTGKFFPFSFPKGIPTREQKKIISLLIALLIAAFPLYLVWLLGMAADHPAAFFLQSTRNSFVELMDMGPGKYTFKYVFFINLLGLAPMVAVIAWLERKGHRKRALLAVIIAVLYFVLTGARSTIIQLLLSLLCVEWLLVRHLKLKLLATISLTCLIVFGGIAILVHPNGENRSTGEKIASASNELVGYIGGPLVAFDRVVRQPNVISHEPNAASFFLETASKLGMRVEVPSRLTEFVNTGPDRQDNVFTIYFNYFDIGMPLALFIISIEAFFLTLIYRHALSGSKIAIIVYAYLLSCIAMSTFSDWLMGTLNTLIKTSAFAWLLYAFPIAKARFARFLASSAGRLNPKEVSQL